MARRFAKVSEEIEEAFFYPSDLIKTKLRVGEERWIYTSTLRVEVYPPLFTSRSGDSCFSIYQIRWIKKRFFNFFWNFRETTRHFSLRSQNSEYPRMFQVTGPNQNARKLLSTDLVNTKLNYSIHCYLHFHKGIWVTIRVHSSQACTANYANYKLIFLWLVSEWDLNAT